MITCKGQIRTFSCCCLQLKSLTLPGRHDWLSLPNVSTIKHVLHVVDNLGFTGASPCTFTELPPVVGTSGRNLARLLLKAHSMLGPQAGSHIFSSELLHGSTEAGSLLVQWCWSPLARVMQQAVHPCLPALCWSAGTTPSLTGTTNCSGSLMTWSSRALCSWSDRLSYASMSACHLHSAKLLSGSAIA